MAVALTSLEIRLNSSLVAHVGAPPEVNPISETAEHNLAGPLVTVSDTGPDPTTTTTACATPQATPERFDDNTQGDTDGATTEGDGVDAMFCTPPVPLLQQTAARQP
jgi:hypothetical protein